MNREVSKETLRQRLAEQEVIETDPAELVEILRAATPDRNVGRLR